MSLVAAVFLGALTWMVVRRLLGGEVLRQAPRPGASL